MTKRNEAPLTMTLTVHQWRLLAIGAELLKPTKLTHPADRIEIKLLAKKILAETRNHA